jgi:hypothetical protein
MKLQFYLERSASCFSNLIKTTHYKHFCCVVSPIYYCVWRSKHPTLLLVEQLPPLRTDVLVCMPYERTKYKNKLCTRTITT